MTVAWSRPRASSNCPCVFVGAVRAHRYDLNDRHDRARVHEQVLAEGTDDDVRFYMVVDDLIELWLDLVLPHHVSRAWADWLAVHLGVVVAC
jgi:hypothetical protein